MKDFFTRMRTNKELAAEYDWNMNQRGKPKPKVSDIPEGAFNCEGTSETFEKKKCLGEPTSEMSLDLKFISESWFNYAIGNYIKVTK